MTQLINDTRLIYSVLSYGLLVGTNSKTPGNGAIQGTRISGILSIPDKFQDMPVVEIGQYAFCQCNYITRIIIGRNVKIIHEYSLGDLPNIEVINIPSSVEEIRFHGIYFHDTRYSKVSEGLTQVFFEANSSLKFADGIFSKKNSVMIFSPSKITANCRGSLMQLVTNKYLFSPYTFHFCNMFFKGTNYISKNLCYHHKSLELFLTFFFCIS